MKKCYLAIKEEVNEIIKKINVMEAIRQGEINKIVIKETSCLRNINELMAHVLHVENKIIMLEIVGLKMIQ